MRLYDETCLALCEGQYIDIASSAVDELMSVDGYFDMIGRKTAALIAASIEAGALLATDDERRHRPVPARSAGRSASRSSSTTTCSASGAPSRRPARPRPTSPTSKQTLPVHLRRTSTPAPRTANGSLALYAAPSTRRPDEVAEFIGILERTGARDYTRDQAHRYRDEALAELDAAGVVSPGGRERASSRSSSASSARLSRPARQPGTRNRAIAKPNVPRRQAA